MARLGGPEPHSRRSGVVHLVTATDAEAIEPGPASSRCCSATSGRWTSAGWPARTTAPPWTRCCPSRARRAYDVHPLLDRPAGRPGHRTAPALGAERGHHARPAGRADRRRDREQPAAAGRLPGRHLGGEGGPVRPDVRRVRRAAGRDRGRARLPARRRPGVGRGGAPRREAAARVRRGDRAPGHPGHPQVLRRRVHRDELPRARRDQGLRLAGRRDRGDGRGRGRAHPAPAHAGRRARRAPGTRRRPSWPRSTSGSRAAWPARRRSAWSTRSSSRPPPGRRWPRPSPAAPQRRGQHGNIPL